MPRHRGLTLRKLIESIHHELMTRYFAEKFPDSPLPHHIIMDTDAIESFMEDPRNAQAKGLLLEDFRRINDICEKGKNLLVKAYKEYNIPRNDNLTPQGMAIKLFLDHEDAFDCAYAWFCYYHASGKMSYYRIPGDFSLTDEKLNPFRQEIKAWFKELAKGQECIITPYIEGDSTVILIKHGSYIRTIAYWQEKDVKMQSFRPASEDILVYNKETEVLSIKASLQKDRKKYIESFCRCIMDDETLAESSELETIYTLKPLQDGTFDWNGNEYIKKIILTEAILRLPGKNGSVVKVSSKDVR